MPVRLRSGLVALCTTIAACGGGEHGPVENANTPTDAAPDGQASSTDAAPDGHAISLDAAPDGHAISTDATPDGYAREASASRDGCAFRGDGGILDAATTDSRTADAGCIPGLVWTDTSVRLTLSRWGYLTSPCPYRADRCEMSDAILSALQGLCPIPRPEQSGYDMPNYRIEIIDADGTLTAYRAWGQNVVDRDNPDPTLPTLDVASVERFVKLLDCPPR